MEVAVYNIKGQDTGRKITLNDEVFARDLSEGNAEHTLYLDIKQYLGNQRQGTHKSKERSEVSYSTRKIGRQKGGGGARRGDLNSPVLYHGGRVFGPRPRDYRSKLNKKMKSLARKIVLLVFGAQDKNVLLSVRNVPNALMVQATDLNAYTLLNNDAILMTEDSVGIINDYK